MSGSYFDLDYPQHQIHTGTFSGIAEYINIIPVPKEPVTNMIWPCEYCRMTNLFSKESPKVNCDKCGASMSLKIIGELNAKHLW